MFSLKVLPWKLFKNVKLIKIMKKTLLNLISEFVYLNKKENIMFNDIVKRFKKLPNFNNKDILIRFWLFYINEVLVELLKSCFYITEHSNNKQEYFYYRKKTWKIIKLRGLMSLTKTKDSIYKEELIENENKNIPKFKLRLFPKKNIFRPRPIIISTNLKK